MTRPCAPLGAQLGLVAVVAALLLDVAALAVDIVRGNRLRAGATIDTVGLDISSTLSTAANAAVPVAVGGAAVTFAWWFWCSYRRLAAAGLAEREPIWGLLAWLVPGLNLVLPPSIMGELATRPTAGPDGTAPVLVVGWWVLWIEGAVIQVALRFIRPDTALGWSNWQWAALLSDLILMAAAGCALVLVRVVTGRQATLRVATPTGVLTSATPGLDPARRP